MPLTLRPTGRASPAQADRQERSTKKASRPAASTRMARPARRPALVLVEADEGTDPVGRPDHQQREGGKVRKTAKN